MSDIIERAEAEMSALRECKEEIRLFGPVAGAILLLPELIAELKNVRAENKTLRNDAEMWRGVQRMFSR